MRRPTVRHRSERHASLSDGTTWALPEPDDGDTNTVEWKLRYAPNQITREDQLYLASVYSSFAALLGVSLSRSREVLRALRGREAGGTTTGEGELHG